MVNAPPVCPEYAPSRCRVNVSHFLSIFNYFCITLTRIKQRLPLADRTTAKQRHKLLVLIDDFDSIDASSPAAVLLQCYRFELVVKKYRAQEVDRGSACHGLA
jgi:hypothetical protein